MNIFFNVAELVIYIKRKILLLREDLAIIASAVLNLFVSASWVLVLEARVTMMVLKLLFN